MQNWKAHRIQTHPAQRHSKHSQHQCCILMWERISTEKYTRTASTTYITFSRHSWPRGTAQHSQQQSCKCMMDRKNTGKNTALWITQPAGPEAQQNTPITRGTDEHIDHLLFNVCNTFTPEIYKDQFLFVSLFYIVNPDKFNDDKNLVDPFIFNDDKRVDLLLTNTLFKYEYPLTLLYQYLHQYRLLLSKITHNNPL